mmetsp:Transcript_817/g.1821  ORF Transcript_817/g.1821 Transcript_817/m.1821 type:complete len:363 (+) Transcript_817:547-1635(+)
MLADPDLEAVGRSRLFALDERERLQAVRTFPDRFDPSGESPWVSHFVIPFLSAFALPRWLAVGAVVTSLFVVLARVFPLAGRLVVALGLLPPRSALIPGAVGTRPRALSLRPAVVRNLATLPPAFVLLFARLLGKPIDLVLLAFVPPFVVRCPTLWLSATDVCFWSGDVASLNAWLRRSWLLRLVCRRNLGRWCFWWRPRRRDIRWRFGRSRRLRLRLRCLRKERGNEHVVGRLYSEGLLLLQNIFLGLACGVHLRLGIAVQRRDALTLFGLRDDFAVLHEAVPKIFEGVSSVVSTVVDAGLVLRLLTWCRLRRLVLLVLLLFLVFLLLLVSTVLFFILLLFLYLLIGHRGASHAYRSAVWT